MTSDRCHRAHEFLQSAVDATASAADEEIAP